MVRFVFIEENWLFDEIGMLATCLHSVKQTITNKMEVGGREMWTWPWGESVSRKRGRVKERKA